MLNEYANKINYLCKVIRYVISVVILFCIAINTTIAQNNYEEYTEEELVHKFNHASSDSAKLKLCSIICYISTEIDSVFKYAKIGISLCKEKDSAALGICYSYLAWAQCYQNDYENAIENYKKSIEICQSLNMTTETCIYCIGLANNYHFMHDYPNMWKYLYKSLELAWEIKDTANICYCYNTMATVYASQKMMVQANEVAYKSLRLCQQTQDYSEMAVIAGKMAEINASDYSDSTSCRNAIKWARLADSYYAIGEGTDTYYFIEMCCNYETLTTCYLKLAEFSGNNMYYDSALVYLNRYDNIENRKINDEDSEIGSLQLHARQQIYLHNYTNAISLLHKALSISEKSGSTHTYKDTYLLLSTAYEKKADYNNAMKYFELYADVENKMSGARTVMQSAAFDAKAEVEREKRFINYENQLVETEHELRCRHYSRIIIAVTAAIVAIAAIVVLIMRSLKNTRRSSEILISQNEEIKSQSEQINKEKNKIAETNIKIQSSMKYAQRIQTATLSSEQELSQIFPEALLFYKPHDFVSGDWYWTEQIGRKKILAVGGSARHGVPGAMVCMMTVNALKETVSQIANGATLSPTAILRTVNAKLPQTARSNDAGISLCVFGNKSVKFAAVKQNAMLVRNGNPIVMRGDQPGDLFFTVSEGDSIFLYSASTKRQLLQHTSAPEEYCQKLATLSSQQQKALIEQELIDKKQQSDVTVVAIKI